MRIAIIILLVSCISAAQTARRITGNYSNQAFGYEVTIPEGLLGTADDEGGSERGFSISLPSGGTIALFGEPNTLEWKTPMDGIRHSLGAEKCDSGRRQGTAFGRTHGDEGQSRMRRSRTGGLIGVSHKSRSSFWDDTAYNDSKEN